MELSVPCCSTDKASLSLTFHIFVRSVDPAEPMKKNLFFCLSLLFLPLLVAGQGDFRHLTIREGLSSNRSYRAVQDSTGFVWITTDEGVDRYDGRSVVHYPLEKYEESAGMGYQFNRIFIDGKDRIYVLTNRCYAYRLDRRTDRFILLPAFEKYYGKYVVAAAVDPSGRMLVSTSSNMLVYEKDQVQEMDVPGIHENVFCIHPVEGGYLLGCRNSLFRLSASLDSISPLVREILPGSRDVICDDLYVDAQRDRIWLGTKNAGLLWFEPGDSVCREAGDNGQMKEFPIWDLQSQDENTLLAGTDGAGLFRYDLEQERVTGRYRYDPDREEGLTSNVIHGILRTDQGLFFMTTDIGGVNILNPYRLGFVSLVREKGNPNSLRNNVIHAIDEVEPGVIAFGTDRGVSLWYRKENRWVPLEKEGSGGKNQVATAITHASDGTFWVAYFIRRMKVYHASSVYDHLPDDLADCRNSKALYFDDETSTLWSDKSRPQVKLISYDYRSHTVTRYTLPPVTALEGYGEKVLAGTTGGLFFIDKRTHDLKRFGRLHGHLQRITCLATGPSGIIWTGSDGGGVACLYPGGDSIRVYDHTRGLASDRVLTMETDSLGRLWALTETGLSRIDPTTGEIISYFVSDGITPGDFKYSASCRTSAGEIIIGGTNGATLFNPITLGKPKVQNRLVFTDLYVNQKKISGGSKPLPGEMLDRTDRIILMYNENAFSIGFSNIDFLHPEQARFSWKLEGIDEEWSPPATANRAVYTNIPPGKYVFRVKLVSPFFTGKNIPERSLYIHIRPPFWKTPLAFVLYVLVILFLVLLVLYYNKLMHDVRSTREKLRYIANMAHEIKTPLTLIRAPISDLMRQTKDERETEKLSLAMNNVERLQKKISQFLDFRRIEKPGNIHPEKIELVNFVRKKIFAFDLVARKKDVKIHFEAPPGDMEVYCDPDLLDRILSNLLSNAVKYNIPGGFVNVRLQREESWWVLTVTDSGIGIPRKEQKRIFRPFFRAGNAVGKGIPGSGVGLALVYDMVKALKGTIAFTSSEGKGATFVIKLPVGQPGKYDDDFDRPSPGKEEGREESGAAPEGSFHILIVEDDTELREYMQKEMSRHYRVTVASDGQEALQKVQKELPDLVLADVAMPGMNGRQLCLSIKSDPATSHIPVILLSGLDSKEHILKGLEAGADDYITKPFDPSILIARISSLINNRKKLREKLLDPDAGYNDADIRSDLDRDFVRKITRVIEENLDDPDLSVRMLYTRAGMSRTAFYHKLHSLIDLSPAEFIRTIRLNKARELLRSGKYNVSEVAYMCGFSDAKYFSTAFKKQFGRSPSSCLGRER